MKKKFLLFLGFGWAGMLHAQCPAPTGSAVLNVNNVKAMLHLDGTLWNDQVNKKSGYEIPIGSGNHSLNSAGLLIGGLDELDRIHLAGQDYGGNDGNDYWAGPIDQNTSKPYNCDDFDRFFTVSLQEIQSFISEGTISDNIKNWPARGNPNLNYLPDQDLAPFKDINEDGKYDPNDGDYPKIKGEKAYWWVMNDVGGMHEITGGDQFGAEIQMMAYAFNSGDLRDQTFYEIKIINKSSEKRLKSYFGLFLDPDLGNPKDDFVGIDTSLLTAYVYNGDSFDDPHQFSNTPGYGYAPPVQGIAFSDKPKLNMNKSINLSSFMVFNTQRPASDGIPQYASDYYRSFQGKRTFSDVPFKNPITGEETKFLYHDNPADVFGWSECSVNNFGTDRGFIISFGPFDMESGDELTASFGAIYHESSSENTCEGPGEYLDLVAGLDDFWNEVETLDVKEEMEQPLDYSIMPNPASGVIHISGIRKSSKLEIYNSVGEIVLKQNVEEQNTINIEKLETGIYLLSVSDEERYGVQRLVVK